MYTFLKYLGILLVTGTSGILFAQHPLRLDFRFVNEGVPFEPGEVVTNLTGVKYFTEHIAFYISDLEIEHDGGQVFSLPDSAFIVRQGNTLIDLGMQDIDQVERISFFVGLPETLNHSDITAYPESHPLSFQDPSMHWGWSTGYAFFLIDGKADADHDDIPEQVFQLHSFGDNNLIGVSLANAATVLSDGTREIYTFVNVDQWLAEIDLMTVGIQHTSTGVNTLAMRNIDNFPVFTAPANLGVSENAPYTGSIWFTAATESLAISWKDLKDATSFELLNAGGQLVATGTASGMNGQHSFRDIPAGTYLFRMFDSDRRLIRRINAVKP